MRTSIVIASAGILLILGGCAAQRQTHVLMPGIESRSWWYPHEDQNIDELVQSDAVGAMAWNQDGSSTRSLLAVGDALGSASFYDVQAYIAKIEVERRDELATVPVE